MHGFGNKIKNINKLTPYEIRVFFVIINKKEQSNMKVINITNGQYFNDYMSKKKEGLFVPFNEALIQGNPKYPLFDNEFIIERTKTHYKDVSKTQDYLDNMTCFLSKSNEFKLYDEIKLWFGEDTFCVINLLSILTYLEQLEYKNKIILNVIDDETYKVLSSNHNIELGKFTMSYKALFYMNKFIPTGYPIIDKGINDYLYLKKEKNHLYKYIKENNDNLSEEELLINLLSQTKEYGLSDVILLEMIKESDR